MELKCEYNTATEFFEYYHDKEGLVGYIDWWGDDYIAYFSGKDCEFKEVWRGKDYYQAERCIKRGQGSKTHW